MIKDLKEIESFIMNALKAHCPPLKIRTETGGHFEVAGTKETMQGRKKVDGYYFASIVPKPKDIRFYFFPIYTHADAYPELSAPMKKCLKGKSCFHIKQLDESLQKELTEMIDRGVHLYQNDELI